MNLEWFLFEFAGLFYVKASVLLTAGILASVLLRRYSASTRYRSWNLCLLLMILLIPASLLTPNWDLSLISPPGYSKLPPIEKVQVAGEGVPARLIPDLLQTDAFNTNHDLSFWEMLWIALLLVWALGVIVLLAKLLGDLIGLARTSRSGNPAPGAWQPLIERTRQRAACRQRVQVRLSDRIGSPLIWGLFRPTILLPDSAKVWSEERLEVVLLHELLHAARHDHTMVVASQLVRCVYWANPLAWIAVHRHSVERELSCDEGVVNCGNDRIAYAEELVAITRDLRRELRYASVAMTEHYGLKARVTSLLDKHPGMRMLARPVAVAMSAGALLLTLSVATASVIRQPDPESTEALVGNLFGADISLADQAALRLGERGDRAAVPYLAKLAYEAGAAHTRMQSLLALGKIGGEEALMGVLGAMDVQDEWIRYTAMCALAYFDAEKAVEANWQAWKQDDSAFVRQRAYLTLAEHEQVADPRPVMQWLGSEDVELRRHTVKMTGLICSTKSTAHWLKNNDELGADYCSRVLQQSLGDPRFEVRKTAVEALIAMDDTASRQVLEEKLPLMDEDLKELARAALKSMMAK